jgi:hypothetical protein
MSEPAHDPNLNALEAALASLQPSPPTLDRDRFLFQAGRMSVKPRWVWPALTAASSLTALLLGILLYFPPEPRVQYVYLPAPATVNPPPMEIVQQQPSPAPPGAEEPKSWLTMLRIWPSDRDRQLEQALTEKTAPLPPSPPADESLRQTLGLSRQDWERIHFLGKPPSSQAEGGF